MVFYIGGCKIKIEFSFLLMIAYALLTGTDNILYLLLFASLHEIGHIALLYAFHGRAESITLSFYGAGLKHTSALSVKQEILFLSGGIAVNALFAALNIHREINLPLLLINALPLYPLDGGRILKLLLGLQDKIFKAITVICSFVLAVYALYTANISLILIVIYIIIFSVKEDKQ